MTSSWPHKVKVRTATATPFGVEIDAAKQAGASRRLNVGCGEYPLLYWTNLDGDPKAFADLYQVVPPLPFEDGSLDDVFAGHFLEHLTKEDGAAFLAECFRCLVPGGRLGIVVPDTREILTRYLSGSSECVECPPDTWWSVSDLDDVCALFLYSTVQDSPHRWSYDQRTLRRAMEAAGFQVTGEIDRYRDPRLGSGRWYQMGFDAIKPEAT